jgi:major type 1 subunit fimbrin (pilin)
MKKTFITAALLAAFGVAAAAPLAATAADGTINITGTVTSGTCKVTSGTGTPPTITVALPSVQASALTASGQVAARTAFNIAVTGCGSGVTKATTYFEPGPTVDTATGNLLNATGTGAATNVEVQLLNGNGGTQTAFSPVVLGAAQASENSSTYTLASGAATLNYYAQYYATGAATAGTVNSSVQFTMIYQ